MRLVGLAREEVKFCCMSNPEGLWFKIRASNNRDCLNKSWSWDLKILKKKNSRFAIKTFPRESIL